ncbi:MAG: hypothetical protein BWY66_00374 [bacterium ADurb.Bin374]|nr:MAG: hypothetical protein BWY66_00374 [bacterium ADurb.Bin374]
MKLLDRPELKRAQKHFEVSAAASREHDRLVSRLYKRHGDGNGVQVSGVIRDHFPEKAKARLRALCHVICEENDAGVAARPSGVWLKTMHELAREVCRRDGTGFYGYRI